MERKTKTRNRSRRRTRPIHTRPRQEAQGRAAGGVEGVHLPVLVTGLSRGSSNQPILHVARNGVCLVQRGVCRVTPQQINAEHRRFWDSVRYDQQARPTAPPTPPPMIPPPHHHRPIDGWCMRMTVVDTPPTRRVR